MEEFEDASEIFRKLLQEHLEKANRNNKPPKAIVEKAKTKAEKFSRATLSHLENGRPPTVEHVEGLVFAFGLSGSEERAFRDAAKAFRDRQKGKPTQAKNINGIVKVHSSIPTDLFRDWISTATKRVWIMDTWLTNPLFYEQALVKAAQEQEKNPDFAIRILLLSPRSKAAEQRSIDLILDRVDQMDKDALERRMKVVPRSIQICLDELLEVKQQVDSMEIRTHGSLPSYAIYVCDDKAFISFYIHGEFSDFSPHFEIHFDTNDDVQLIDGVKKRNWFQSVPLEWQKNFIATVMIYKEFESLWRVAKEYNPKKNEKDSGTNNDIELEYYI